MRLNEGIGKVSLGNQFQPERFSVPGWTGHGGLTNAYLCPGGLLLYVMIFDESNYAIRQVTIIYILAGETQSVLGRTEFVSHTCDALYRRSKPKDGANHVTTCHS